MEPKNEHVKLIAAVCEAQKKQRELHSYDSMVHTSNVYQTYKKRGGVWERKKVLKVLKQLVEEGILEVRKGYPSGAGWNHQPNDYYWSANDP